MNKNIVVPKLHFFFQNRTSLIAISLSLALLLNACGGAAAPQPTEAIPAQVGTDVAATLTARPTATATPTMTPTPTPTTTPTATPTAAIPVTGGSLSSFSSCNNSTFIKDVSIPDGKILAPRERFTKTWRLQNTGSCNWLPEYSLVFAGGDRMAGVNVEIGRTVDVNRRVDISVTLIAPRHEGTYTGLWRMVDQFGNPFGETIDVQIVVD